MPREKGRVKREFSKFRARLYKMRTVGRILAYWIVSVLGLVVAAWLSGKLGMQVSIDGDHPVRLFLGVAILGIVNATLGNFLKFATVLLILITFGLFSTIINALLFLWVGGWGIGFSVGGFFDALICSAIMNLIVHTLWRFIK